MHDLRRQALESGKTVSRKARSRQSTTPSSKTNSRAASRVNSRNPSDDEEGNLSDGTAWSSNSIDDLLASDEVQLQTDAWRTLLDERVEQIIDRKRSSVQGREESLAAYIHILTSQYTQEVIHNKIGELVPAFLKSIKSETNEKETVLALKALALTLITEPDESIYASVYQPIKRTMTDSESQLAKVAAVHALGIATFYGGASLAETDDVMAQLLEIVESDGHAVEAGDSGLVVTAALEEWGFLATQLDDIEDITESAMEAFVEQLDSSDPAVQIAAGENIALLYEKSYTPLEAGESASSSEDDYDDEDPDDKNGEKLIKRYDVYRREDQLKHSLSALANVSGRHMSKKDKKSLHTNFADILNTVEYPTRGPRYSNAVSDESGKRFGSRMTVRIHKTGEMRIDKWWKLHRLQALRRVLQGGFVVHYEKNEVVFDSLPIMISRG
ncbi:hypothetical protein EV356DRAFT_496770 [Viridothelium virens]|uniref:Interferon-related developmental regulator N-terminal domain-containing protein n=1 Tax=Viridothelium virens TaxID=1048519 RepID=A0A6A6HGG7_VIRVR|nr:hypothetical protein EV356DRAFT_496770 [Viridothelium virens]